MPLPPEGVVALGGPPEPESMRTVAVQADSPALFWVLVVMVCLSPLPLGAIYPWSWGLLASGVGVLLALWAIRVALGLQDVSVGVGRVWFLVVPFFSVGAWVAIQSSSITPETWHHPLWSSAADSLGEKVAGSISLNPYLSLSHLTRLLSYGGVFWLSLQLCRKSQRARQVLFAVCVAAFVSAVVGLIAYAFGFRAILWIDMPIDEHALTGTFGSADSFAAYAGLGLLCLTAVVQISFAQRLHAIFGAMTRRAFTAGDDDNVRRAKPSLFSAEVWQRLAASLSWTDRWLLLAWACVLAAAVATHSRVGLGSLVIALLALVLVFALSRSLRRGGASTVAAALVLFLGAAFLAGGGRLEKVFLDVDADAERQRVYDLTVSAIQDSPILGTGYGTFEEVFRFYRTSDVEGYYAMAHSTYLESVLELGLPATLLLFAVFAGLFYLTIYGIRSRGRDGIYPCVGFAATILIALHAAADFSLQVPAVAATYALIMGAACAQCWSTRRGTEV
jgi:hypothetical protein